MICTFNKNDKEYKKLAMVAEMLKFESKNGHNYIVRDIYFDLGQDLMWTTIIDETARCQVLNPREQEEIEIANSLEELASIVKEIQNGKYFQDK